MKLEVNITKKYFFIFLTTLIIGLTIVGVIAYNSGQSPSTFGHSYEEIEIEINGTLMTLKAAIDGGLLGGSDGIGSLWESQRYQYLFNEPANSDTVDLGNPGEFSYCAISQLVHDGLNGGGSCYIFESGSQWKLNYGKWAGGGIVCRALCIRLS